MTATSDAGPRVRLEVNGAVRELDVPPDRLLVDILRHDLGLTGTKLGCGIGVCGLCAVIVDGGVQSACLLLAATLDGARVETVEGLAPATGGLAPLQEAFLARGAVQCGICTPGQLMTATALLREDPHPDDEQIRSWMMGALCRCTGYAGIFDAIRDAAGRAPAVAPRSGDLADGRRG